MYRKRAEIPPNTGKSCVWLSLSQERTSATKQTANNVTMYTVLHCTMHTVALDGCYCKVCVRTAEPEMT